MVIGMGHKTHTIQMRVTKAQHKAYHEKAKELGLDVSEWLRGLADKQLSKGLLK